MPKLARLVQIHPELGTAKGQNFGHHIAGTFRFHPLQQGRRDGGFGRHYDHGLFLFVVVVRLMTTIGLVVAARGGGGIIGQVFRANLFGRRRLFDHVAECRCSGHGFSATDTMTLTFVAGNGLVAVIIGVVLTAKHVGSKGSPSKESSTRTRSPRTAGRRIGHLQIA